MWWLEVLSESHTFLWVAEPYGIKTYWIKATSNVSRLLPSKSQGCFSVKFFKKKPEKSYLKWCAVLVAYRLINLLWHEWLQKSGKECNIGPFGVFCTFMKSFITISICLVMTDNFYYEKSSGHQSDRSGWVLLPKEVSVSQDCCWSEQLPRAVLGGRVMSWWIRLQCFFLGI